MTLLYSSMSCGHNVGDWLIGKGRDQSWKESVDALGKGPGMFWGDIFSGWRVHMPLDVAQRHPAGFLHSGRLAPMEV